MEHCSQVSVFVDPLGQPPVMTDGSDNCFHTCRPYVRAFVPTLPDLAKQN